MRKFLFSAALLSLALPVFAGTKACEQNKALDSRDVVLTLPTADGAKTFRLGFVACYDEGEGEAARAVRVYASFDTPYQIFLSGALDGSSVAVTLMQRYARRLMPAGDFGELAVSALLEQSVTWPSAKVADLPAGRTYTGAVTVSAQAR
ncbi:MAG: hypothetical protein WC969_01375 [Elusimicrobiota bacterium]|jgi:hypothetical protein